MLKRLVNLFVEATRDKVTKRQIEWMMADFLYCVYLFIMLCSFVAAVIFDTTVGFIVVVVCFLLLMSGWGWFSYEMRKILLTLLYPQDEKVDENGDSRLTSEFDMLNKTLIDMMKNLKEEE